MRRRLPGAIETDVPIRYVGRPERASPSEGYPAAHRTRAGADRADGVDRLDNSNRILRFASGPVGSRQALEAGSASAVAAIG